MTSLSPNHSQNFGVEAANRADAESVDRADTRPARRRVLVVRLDAIGDWLLFRNAFRALRRSSRYAEAHFTVFGNPAWRGLAEAFDHDLADEWIWADRRGDLFRKSYENLLPRAIWHRRVKRAQGRVRAKLAALGFDEVLSLQPIRDPLLDEFVAGLAPEVVGIRCEAIDSSMYTRLLDPGPQPFVFLQARALVSQLACEPCSEPLSLETGATKRGRDILVFTGASHWTRRWPRRRVRALVRLLLDRTDRRILLADGAHVASLRAFARSFQSHRVEALPAMPFPDFARRVASAGAMVANDTMALHLAAATDTPVAGIANGISGRDGFWPYPATLGKRVTVVGTEPRHLPVRFLPRLVASQLAQYRNLAAVSAETVFATLSDLLRITT